MTFTTEYKQGKVTSKMKVHEMFRTDVFLRAHRGHMKSAG